ncbi:MAG: BatA domain-containing protein [Deferrisomatales bacterium]|nr:BatA domain-containing protein [Deferrisomatales bacterium]
MDFLRTGLLWGLAAVALPILIHLLGRRRVRTVPIATLRFLERARVRASAHLKLRRVLLLATRVALLAVLALLFAGPGCETPHATPGARTWAVVLDTSPSMAAARGGPSSIEKARGAVLSLLETASPDDRFFVATTSARSGGVPGESRALDRDATRRWVSGSAVEYGPHGVAAALERALALVADTPRSGVVLVTDLQAATWPADPLGRDGGFPLRVVDVGLPDPVNAWVDGVAVEEGGTGGGPGRVAVRLGRSGPAVGGQRTVSLEAGEGGRLLSFVDDGEAAFHTRLPAEVTGAAVELSPGGDLAGDDRLEFVVGGRLPTRALLVNGDPRGFEIRDELLFVRRALAAATRLGRRLQTREMRLGDLDGAALQAADVVLLANPGPLPRETVALLLHYLEDGGGLVVSAGDRWQLDRQGEDAGTGAEVLAAPPRDVVQVPPDDPSRPPYLGLDEGALGGPLARFRNPQLGGLAQTRVHKYWVLDASAGSGLEIWARLENGVPLVMERGVGRGRSLLLTTTMDRDGADLCLQPAFLPLLETLLLHAADRLRPPLERWALAGFPHPLPYAGSVQVQGADGELYAWSPGTAFVPPVPGVYRVRIDGATADAFAARLPAAESDLRRLTTPELEQRLGSGGYTLGVDVAGPEVSDLAGRRDLSGRLAILLLLLLAGEVLLSTRWHRRATRDILGGDLP